MPVEAQVVGTDDIERQASVIIRKVTYDIQARMIDLIRMPKSGRVYRRRGGSHQASAPGEAPASDSGTLLNAIAQGASFPSRLEGQIDIPLEYAELLEFELDRPFLRPAVNDVIARLKRADIISTFDRLI
jgi:hypothetical protein